MKTAHVRRTPVPCRVPPGRVVGALEGASLDPAPNRARRAAASTVGEYSVKKHFVLACKKAGVNDLHSHDLRHEAISRFAESGKCGLLDLQAICGHRDTRMLLRYTHLCVQQLAHKMDEIPAQDIKYAHKGRRRRARLKLEGPVAGVKPLRAPDPPASTRLSERADYAVNGNVIVAAFGSTRVAGGHR